MSKNLAVAKVVVALKLSDMNELLSNLSHLTSVVGTVFMVGVWLIALAKMIYSELRAIEYIIKLAQGLTFAFVVTTLVMIVDYLL